MRPRSVDRWPVMPTKGFQLFERKKRYADDPVEHSSRSV
jgi:hypothetical protein